MYSMSLSVVKPERLSISNLLPKISSSRFRHSGSPAARADVELWLPYLSQPLPSPFQLLLFYYALVEPHHRWMVTIITTGRTLFSIGQITSGPAMISPSMPHLQ